MMETLNKWVDLVHKWLIYGVVFFYVGWLVYGLYRFFTMESSVELSFLHYGLAVFVLSTLTVLLATASIWCINLAFKK